MPLPVLPGPDPGLGLVVVVPALAEPNAISTMDSVAAASRPDCAVELLLVINAPEDAGVQLRRLNENCYREACDWVRGRHDGSLKCHVLDYCALPADHAGVGLARKLGMDIALARLAASDSGCGIIASLDADCQVAPTYLTAVEEYFTDTPAALGATICFEHPIDETPAELRQAIIDYELHLRCYKQGLAAAGSPYAHHTVGSALAVRSEIYAQEGGMNRRAAGEDFYFINKLLKRGKVGSINGTTVFPSARVSERVPFGTGAAILRARTESQTTYAPAVYRELRLFRNALAAFSLNDRPAPSDPVRSEPSNYAPFLDSMAFDQWLRKTRANVASVESLDSQLNRWLDGFRTMKFINWLTASRYPRVPVADAARRILGSGGHCAAGQSQAMLEQFRLLDRGKERV